MADWSTLAGAVIGGSLLPKMFGVVKRWMGGSTIAEARKINAEADNIVIENLRQEVLRLSDEVNQLRTDFDKAQRVADDEKTRLIEENRKLTGQVRRLTRRVEGLEEIFRVHETPAEMKAALDELDRKTGEGK